MKKAILLLTSFAALLFTTGLGAQNLSELVAPGKKGYVEIDDPFAGTDSAMPSDEYVEIKLGVLEAGSWAEAKTAGEADFVMHISAIKQRDQLVFRTTLTPSVRTKDGNVLWQGKPVWARGAAVNGFRSTYGATKAMARKCFEKDLFKLAGRD